MAKRLTETDIEAACWGITRDGKYPSNEAIRQFLGSGSFQTIQKYAGKWRAEHKNELDNISYRNETVPKDIMLELKRTYNNIRNYTENELETETISRLKEEIEELKKENEDMNKALEDVKAVNLELRTEIRESKASREQLERMFNTAMEQIAALSAAAGKPVGRIKN